MADITTLYTLLQNSYIDITIFNIGWILSIPLVIGTSIIITRDKGAWAFLWLPLTIIYHIIGVKPSYIWYIIATMIFVFRIFSTDTIGNLVWTSTRQSSQDMYQSTNTYKKRSFNRLRNKNEKSLMEKIFLSKEGTENNKKYQGYTKEELLDAIIRGKGK